MSTTVPTWMADMGRRIALARPWTQGTLAVRLGTSPRRVRDWERGRSAPCFATARELALDLGVSLDWLAGLKRCPACERVVETLPHCSTEQVRWSPPMLITLNDELEPDEQDGLWELVHHAEHGGDASTVPREALVKAVDRRARELRLPPLWDQDGHGRCLRADLLESAPVARRAISARMMGI